MKIVKFTPSYRRINAFGAGQNAFFHNKYAKDTNIINYTFYNKDPIFENLSNTVVKEVKFGSFLIYVRKLGVPGFVVQALKYTLLLCWSVLNVPTFFGHRPDVVHIYTLVGMPIGLVLKLFRFKGAIIVSLHGTDARRLRSSKFLQLLIRNFDAVLLVSESDFDFCKQLGLLCYFIGNGYDSENFINLTHRREKIILNVGSLRWQKDHKTCIEAFNQSRLFEHGYQLHIVGAGPYKKRLEKLIDQLSLDAHVVFLGNLPPHKVADLMNISEIFVLSSKSEGFPKVILEALGCGLKVASTDVGGIRTRLPDECLYSPVSDCSKLSENLIQLTKMNFDDVKSQQQDAIRPYAWPNVAKRVTEIYEAL